jgi:hypothetical protein
LVKDLGGDHLRATVETALNLSGLAFSTVSASRASRRAWWLTLLGTVVAIVVATPQIHAALDVAKKWKLANPWDALLDPVRTIASWNPWAILLAVVIAFAAVRVASRLMIFVRAFFSVIFQRRGFSWPTLISVSRKDDDDEEDEPENTTEEPPGATT